MKYNKLIAIDLDGTWLCPDSSISEKNKAVVQKAIDAGCLVVPTTGRSYRNAREVLKGYQGLRYFINANGSTVADADGEKIIHQEAIPFAVSSEIYRLCAQYENFIELYEGLDAYVDKYGKQYIYQAGLAGSYCDQLLATNVVMDSLDDFMENSRREITKFHIVCTNVDRKRQLEQRIGKLPGVYPVSTFPQNIEIVNGHWSKKDGLEKLAGYLGISREEVMAIGDSDNDIEMLSWAGCGVCMKNGNANAKAAADYVTASNSEDGVACALEKFL